LLKKVNGLNTIYKDGNNLKRKIKKESRKQKKGECFMITIKTAKKQKLKESKGITLIALVITIIVLLILAGVTIATLTGNNGILGKANEAKTKSDIVEVKEQAQLDISNWMAERIRNGEDTVLDDATVKSIIESANQNNTNKYYSELTDTSIKTKKGNEILYSDLYTKTTPSFDPETLTIGTAINTSKYGWKVKNYNVEENETGGWRLFFQDNNYAYLISDKCIGSYTPSGYYRSYTNGSFVSTIGQKLNPKISSLFTESNTNENIRATAWLTDTSDASMWAKYKNDNAVFAIRKSNSRIICSIL
jgi:type II secretory pathway pseudopilin PulG